MENLPLMLELRVDNKKHVAHT